MSMGLDNLQLCDLFFGGLPRRMSNAFKFFCLKLKYRYYGTVVGYQGLSREVHNFGYYATKVVQIFNQERFLIDNVTREIIDLEGLVMDETACRTSLMIDG